MSLHYGVIQTWNKGRKFGHIRMEGEYSRLVFFHESDVLLAWQSMIAEGRRVHCDWFMAAKGPIASGIMILAKDPAPPVRLKGVVKSFNPLKRYGNIAGPKGDVFFHEKAIRWGFGLEPRSGHEVTFEMGEYGGRPCAVRISLEGGDPDDESGWEDDQGPIMPGERVLVDPYHGARSR